MPISAMKHTIDPKQKILDFMKPYLNGMEVMGEDVLLAVYVRPTTTAGGIILTSKTREEDVYQGLSCLILKMGPLAFVEDAEHKYGDRKPQAGDWVAVRKSEGYSFKVGHSSKEEDQMPCRLMNERGVRLIISDPDSVW